MFALGQLTQGLCWVSKHKVGTFVSYTGFVLGKLTPSLHLLS